MMESVTHGLTTIELNADEFDQRELTIQRGRQAFLDVGRALLDIREAGLTELRQRGYADFGDYVQQRWDMSWRRADQLMSTVRVAGAIGTIVPTPINEGQSRPLTQLLPQGPGAVADAWQEVVETAPNGHVTAAHVESVVERRLSPMFSTSPPAPWTDDELQLVEGLKAGMTIVLSYRIHRNLIDWADQQGLLVRIDRQSDWGNPFELDRDGDRAAVIENYRDHYLPYKPSLLSRVRALRGKALACWCAPLRCHGDVLMDAALVVDP